MSSPFRRLSRTACAVALVCLAMTAATSWAADGLDAALRTALDDSAAGWTSGDLDRFMSVYEDSADVTYVGPKGLVQGYAAIREMYAPRFAPAAMASHGKLSVDFLQTRPLGADHALLLGRYHLTPTKAGSAEASGLFSLTFHRRDGRWRIVCDHTS